jgi:hypothetical protein
MRATLRARIWKPARHDAVDGFEVLIRGEPVARGRVMRECIPDLAGLGRATAGKVLEA